MPAKLVVDGATNGTLTVRKTATLTLENGGTTALVIDSITEAKPKPGVPQVAFTFKWHAGSIAPGKTKKVTVTHHGVAGGGATMKISSNGGSKSITLVAIAGEGVPVNPCFAADTLVLLAGGRTAPIAELAVGDELWTIDELSHASGVPKRVSAQIEHVLSHPGEAMVDVGGIRVTAKHRWAVRDRVEPRFVTTDALVAGAHELLACEPVGWHPVPSRTPAASVDTVWNLTTTARTYCVAAAPRGPYFVVHNMKPSRENPSKSPKKPRP